MPETRIPGQRESGVALTLASGEIAYLRASVAADAVGNIVGENPFNYAGVTGGITTTADTAISAAQAAGVRNYLTAFYFKNTSAVASEIVVKDGATVIWRGHAGASMAQGERIVFPVPLRGTAATAMNVAMITSATATIVSAQGYTGS